MNGKTKVAQLELTALCNKGCTYCYNSDELKDLQELSDEGWLELIGKRKIDEEIILTGGEPLVRKELVFKILETHSDATISINTNLLLAKQKDLARLVELNASLMVSLHTSGMNGQVSKYFDEMQSRLSYLIEGGLRPIINMIVTLNNTGTLKTTAKFFKQAGVDRFYATPVQGINGTEPLSIEQTVEVMDDLLYLQKTEGMEVGIAGVLPHCIVPSDSKYNQFLTKKCSAGEEMRAISPDGNEKPCMSSLKQELKMPEPCYDCGVLDQCGGGCKVITDYELTPTDQRRDLGDLVYTNHHCRGD